MSLMDVVRFNEDGLVPVVAQQHDTGEVLMLAWMDRAAIDATLATRRVTYFLAEPAGRMGQGRNFRTRPAAHGPQGRLRR